MGSLKMHNAKYCEVGKYLLSVSGSALKSPKKKIDQPQNKKVDQPEVESKTENESQETNLQRDVSKMEVDGESCLLVDIPLSQYEVPDLGLDSNKSKICMVNTPKLLDMEIRRSTVPTYKPQTK